MAEKVSIDEFIRNWRAFAERHFGWKPEPKKPAKRKVVSRKKQKEEKTK